MTIAPKALKNLTLRRSFSWTFLGNGVYAACQWGILVLLAKLGSPEMVGQFTLGLAVVAPIVLLSELHLRAVQATDANQQYEFADYLGLRIMTSAIALLVILLVAGTGSFSWQSRWVIGFIGLAKGFEAISDVLYGFLQQYERMDWVARSLLWKGPCSLIAVGISLWLTQNTAIAALSLALVWGGLLLFHDIPSSATLLARVQPQSESAQRRGQFFCCGLPSTWHIPTLTRLLRLSLPLGLVMMMISLNSNIPRYFIEAHLGDRALGIFAALSYLMVVTGMIVDALGESMSPRLAKYYAAGQRRDFQTLLCQILAMSLGLGLLGIVVAAVGGKALLNLIYQAEYAEQSHLFVWLMVVAALGNVASILGFAMTAARIFKLQTILFGMTTLVSAIGCFLFLPPLGLFGVVMALLGAAILQLVISAGVVLYSLYRLPSRSIQSD
jgi:O-antigen/teichoic acid export membrane protein